jgi:hypothetical protein
VLVHDGGGAQVLAELEQLCRALPARADGGA